MSTTTESNSSRDKASRMRRLFEQKRDLYDVSEAAELLDMTAEQMWEEGLDGGMNVRETAGMVPWKEVVNAGLMESRWTRTELYLAAAAAGRLDCVPALAEPATITVPRFFLLYFLQQHFTPDVVPVESAIVSYWIEHIIGGADPAKLLPLETCHPGFLAATYWPDEVPEVQRSLLAVADAIERIVMESATSIHEQHDLRVELARVAEAARDKARKDGTA